VLLAWADSSASGTPGPSALAWLGASQVRRHAALDGVRAARFAAGRWLLAQLVAELVPGAGIAFSSVCPRCGGDHGPPVAVGLPVSVSVSYAASMVAVGAVHDRDAAGLGIDLESERPGAGGRLLELAPLFAPRDPPDLRGWTMIEAALKADGRGLRVPPGDVVLEASVADVHEAPGTVVLEAPAGDVLEVPAADGAVAGAPRRAAASVLGEAAVRVAAPGRLDVVEVAPVPGPPGYVLSVAVVARR
jgi:4'-phosphopantetheinyl transferase